MKICLITIENWLKIYPNTKFILKMFQNIWTISPKCRNFAKSGHIARSAHFGRWESELILAAKTLLWRKKLFLPDEKALYKMSNRELIL